MYQSWPSEGAWLVNLRGTCAPTANAGARDPHRPERDSSANPRKFFPRPATDAEIEKSLKALTEGGNK